MWYYYSETVSIFVATTATYAFLGLYSVTNTEYTMKALINLVKGFCRYWYYPMSLIYKTPIKWQNAPYKRFYRHIKI